MCVPLKHTPTDTKSVYQCLPVHVHSHLSRMFSPGVLGWSTHTHTPRHHVSVSMPACPRERAPVQDFFSWDAWVEHPYAHPHRHQVSVSMPAHVSAHLSRIFSPGMLGWNTDKPESSTSGMTAVIFRGPLVPSKLYW